MGAKIIKHFKFIRVYHLKLVNNVSVKDAIETLKKNPAVEYAETEKVYHTNN
jgi:hypothetical protein